MAVPMIMVRRLSGEDFRLMWTLFKPAFLWGTLAFAFGYVAVLGWKSFRAEPNSWAAIDPIYYVTRFGVPVAAVVFAIGWVVSYSYRY